MDEINDIKSDFSEKGSDESLLAASIFPKESYQDGVYFKDLSNRGSFAREQYSTESKREFLSVFASPISSVQLYFSKYVMTGMGLFVEGYVLFSIGNLTPLFAAAWPTCWKAPYSVCGEQLIFAVVYMEILGIIFGQVIVGIEGDWIGRKFGLVQDAVIMFFGVVLLTSVWGATLKGWVIAYAISLFVYSFGVGGEYPMVGSHAIEHDSPGPATNRDDRLHRGRNVVLSFLMQGWGQIINQIVLLILLTIFTRGKTEPPYSVEAAQLTFRVSFALVGILHAWLIYYRMCIMPNPDGLIKKAKAETHTSGYDMKSLKLVTGHYWHRLMATAGAWFCNDFFFYGNKIFASTFIQVIKPGASLFTTWEFNLINIAVSLVGYYCAAFLIDHKSYGRKRMQQVGFFMDFLLFLFAAIFFKELQQPGRNIQGFQVMYYLSSFFNQFGPNCTTFLVAAEVFPSQIRSTAHGFSAAVGKLGALAPTILYNYIPNSTKFYVVPWFGLAGALLTFFFLPDTTGLDLREQERYWDCVRSGRENEYHGIAIHPDHLSWYERVILKRDRNYDPILDKEARIDELRILYESSLIAREDFAHKNDDHVFISDDVAAYFNRESIEGKVDIQAAKERKLKRSAPAVVHESLLSKDIE